MAACDTMKTHGLLLFFAITWGVLCPTAEELVIHEGDNASFAWKQPDPPVREFSILKSGNCIFNVTNYDDITPCTTRVKFTGHVTSKGHGLFSFILMNVTLEDGGTYTCHHEGSSISSCGEQLHVLDVPSTCGLKGDPLSVSWKLPNPGFKEFTVMKSGRCVSHIVNYNQVTKCGNTNGHFASNITLSRTGVFSFDLPELTSSDDGYFRCYVGPPNSNGSRIPACGQEVSVINDLQHPYIVRPDTITSGEPLTLACHFNTDVDPRRYHHIIASFTWRKNGVVLETGQRYNLTSRNRQWEPKVRYYVGYLTINDVGTEAESDSYTCEAELYHCLHTQQSNAITIGKKLSTALYTNHTLAREGGNASMVWKLPRYGVWYRIENPRSSTVMSTLKDTVYVWERAWTKIRISGLIVFPDSRALLLTMYNVTSADAGHYRCSQSMCDNVLVVQKRPSKPTVVQGKTSLTCSSTAQTLPKEYSPPLSYIWRRNAQLLQRGGDYWMDGSHHSLPITICLGGRYSCQAKEGSLTSEWSGHFSLEGKDPALYVSAPVQATPGQTLTLTCFSKARNPSWATQVAISWTRNYIRIEGGQRYQMRDGSLTITDIREEDQGVYSCLTEKQCSETAEVVVLDPGPYVIAPVQATPGQTLTLTCSSPARNLSRDIQVAYSWTRNTIRIEGGQRYQMRDGSLTITDIREEDQGEYSCRTERQSSTSEWSEAIEVMVLAYQPHTTYIVAGACAAVIASVAVIFIVFLLLYKKMKRSLELRCIKENSVRMSDIRKPAVNDEDYYTLIQD